MVVSGTRNYLSTSSGYKRAMLSWKCYVNIVKATGCTGSDDTGWFMTATPSWNEREDERKLQQCVCKGDQLWPFPDLIIFCGPLPTLNTVCLVKILPWRGCFGCFAQSRNCRYNQLTNQVQYLQGHCAFFENVAQFSLGDEGNLIVIWCTWLIAILFATGWWKKKTVLFWKPKK